MCDPHRIRDQQNFHKLIIQREKECIEEGGAKGRQTDWANLDSCKGEWSKINLNSINLKQSRDERMTKCASKQSSYSHRQLCMRVILLDCAVCDELIFSYHFTSSSSSSASDVLWSWNLEGTLCESIEMRMSDDQILLTFRYLFYALTDANHTNHYVNETSIYKSSTLASVEIKR